MDLLALAADGFRAVDADPALKEQALRYLRQWLGGAEFAPYRPQVEWLVQTREWAGLLDRFYQILPLCTGGRRGAGRGGGHGRHYLATPELSFTIRHLGAHGGLNISASQNPPDDNDGKFYVERGDQPVT